MSQVGRTNGGTASNCKQNEDNHIIRVLYNRVDLLQAKNKVGITEKTSSEVSQKGDELSISGGDPHTLKVWDCLLILTFLPSFSAIWNPQTQWFKARVTENNLKAKQGRWEEHQVHRSDHGNTIGTPTRQTVQGPHHRLVISQRRQWKINIMHLSTFKRIRGEGHTPSAISGRVEILLTTSSYRFSGYVHILCHATRSLRTVSLLPGNCKLLTGENPNIELAITIALTRDALVTKSESDIPTFDLHPTRALEPSSNLLQDAAIKNFKSARMFWLAPTFTAIEKKDVIRKLLSRRAISKSTGRVFHAINWEPCN